MKNYDRNVKHTRSQNSQKIKSRSHVLELEVKLAEMLQPLDNVRLQESNSEFLRSEYFKIYQKLFDDIIQASPYSELLQKIKNAYEEDPAMINRTE